MPIPPELVDLPSGCDLIAHYVADERVTCLAWSPDGQELVFGQAGGPLVGLRSGERAWEHRVHPNGVYDVAWAPSTQLAWVANRAPDRGVLDVSRGLNTVLAPSSLGYWHGVGWSPDGTSSAWVSPDGGELNGRRGGTSLPGAFWLAWDPTGETLSIAGQRRAGLELRRPSGELVRVIPGATRVSTLAWSPEGVLGVALLDGSIELRRGNDLGISGRIESTEGACRRLAVSEDGRLLAARSRTALVVYRLPSGARLMRLDDLPSQAVGRPAAFNPVDGSLAAIGSDGRSVIQLRFDAGVAPTASPQQRSYRNAKVVLVGDSGVGKSGLALRLAGEEFRPTASSHGREVRQIERRTVAVSGGTEAREVYLWDLAGQPGYRLVHQLQLQDVAVALVVFDAQRETAPFASVRHWAKALRTAQTVHGGDSTTLRMFLVAARTDRGGALVSQGRIDACVNELGFDGYFATSAREGRGLSELQDVVRGGIDWESLPRVASEQLFEDVRSFCDAKQEHTALASEDVLLKRINSSRPPAMALTKRAFGVALRRLHSRGLVHGLSFGHRWLLQPERIVDGARQEPDSMGCISESDVRAGRFPMAEDARLPDGDQETLLLIAAVEEMLSHEIALREPADDGTWLVFPSEVRKDHDSLPDPPGKAAIYRFEGPVANVFATLAVRLAHSSTFELHQPWSNAAEYLRGEERCGVAVHLRRDGEAELIVFYGEGVQDGTRRRFEGFIEAHLDGRTLPGSVHRTAVFTCPTCDNLLPERQVAFRLEAGHRTAMCGYCENRVSLTEPPRSDSGRAELMQMRRSADEAQVRHVGLTSALGEMELEGFADWARDHATSLALVFTDVIGSTALGVRLGDEAMDPVRQAHFEAARALRKRHGGHEIKTIGDAFMIAFHDAPAAMDFALALQKGSGQRDVRIRAGLHVGPVRIHDDDAHGTMVNYCARVEASCDGEQIRTSEAFKKHIDAEKARQHGKLVWRRHLIKTGSSAFKGYSGSHVVWSVTEG